MIKCVSLFSGIGGFELGFERASKKTGIDTKVVFTSEIDKFARTVYKKNFGVEPHGDIRKIKAEDIPNHDILFGGFPCQTFSIAGKRRGFEDTRGTLFFEIARILKRKQPRMFLLENVRGLLSQDKGKAFAKILQTVDELGYDAEWQLLNSKDFRVPQNRERVFVVGHLRGHSRRQIFPITENDRQTNDIQEQNTNCLTARYEGAQAVGSYIVEGQQYAQNIQKTAKCLTGGGHSGGLHSDMTVIKDNNNIRRLTPIECERLQGFPPDWTAKGITLTDKIYITGNICQEVNVQLISVKEKSLTGNQNYALCITKGGKNGGIQTSYIPQTKKMLGNVVLKGVAEIVTAEKCVCDITSHGNDMVMLLTQTNTSKIEETIKKNHILEKMGKKSTEQLLKISLEEKLTKEKLSIISTWIKEIMKNQIFTCVKTGQPIIDVIIHWNLLQQNLSEQNILFSRMENIESISNSQRYKQLGNAVTVNVVEYIAAKILKSLEEIDKYE